MKLIHKFEDRNDIDDFISDFDEVLYDIKVKLSKEDYQKFADKLLITILESKED